MLLWCWCRCMIQITAAPSLQKRLLQHPSVHVFPHSCGFMRFFIPGVTVFNDFIQEVPCPTCMQNTCYCSMNAQIHWVSQWDPLRLSISCMLMSCHCKFCTVDLDG